MANPTTQQLADAQHLDDLTSLQQASPAPTTSATADVRVETLNVPQQDNPSLYNSTVDTRNNEPKLFSRPADSELTTTDIINEGRSARNIEIENLNTTTLSDTTATATADAERSGPTDTRQTVAASAPANNGQLARLTPGIGRTSEGAQPAGPAADAPSESAPPAVTTPPEAAPPVSVTPPSTEILPPLTVSAVEDVTFIETQPTPQEPIFDPPDDGQDVVDPEEPPPPPPPEPPEPPPPEPPPEPPEPPPPEPPEPPPPEPPPPPL